MPPSRQAASPGQDAGTDSGRDAGRGTGPSGEAARLAAEAAKLRASMEEQHKRLEILAEQLNGARERGKQLLLGSDKVDRRWSQAARELAEARENLDHRMSELMARGPDYWTGMRAGPAQALEAGARLRQRQLAVDQGRQRLARAEAAMATAELDKKQLGGSLVAQATEAERLHAAEVEADALAASLEAQVRRMDRRVAELIEAERQREEAEARAAFATWAAGNPGPLPDPGAGAGMAGETASIAVRTALAQRGKPYRWGAEGPDTFDCSGLMQFAYAAAGVRIPRVSRDQHGAFVGSRPVAMRDLRPGDLVFFADRPSDPRTIHHVGMYIGNGLMVEAPYTGAVVRTSSIMRSSYAGAVRPLP